MRWELVPYQNNPMSLVRVKDSSKRVRVPVVLTIEQFQQVLLHIPEPYRTMCVVAGCLGLRMSEVLGLQWCDFDWEKHQVQIRRSWVYGRLGEPKTENSKRPMRLILRWKNSCESIGAAFLRRSNRVHGFSRASARGCPRIRGVHNVAGCSVQEKKLQSGDWAGIRFATLIRPCSTSMGQT
jgi:integrase